MFNKDKNAFFSITVKVGLHINNLKFSVICNTWTDTDHLIQIDLYFTKYILVPNISHDRAKFSVVWKPKSVIN